ncbi:Pao retrotransposon peptidase, partial [Oesophagostomum dentatum]
MYHQKTTTSRTSRISMSWSLSESKRKTVQMRTPCSNSRTTRKTIEIKDGTITAGFPFKNNAEKLKNNFNIAIRRPQALLKTLQKDGDKLMLYSETLQAYIKEGVIEECEEQPSGITSFYLPHRHLKCIDKEHTRVTKRTILSRINGFCFDPLGLLTPLIVPAKVLLQDVHKQKLGWDEMLPEEEQRRRMGIENDIVGFTISIPRKVLDKASNAKHDLSIFVDSSKRAYTCGLYITTISGDGSRVTQRFVGKSKIAPLKKEQTIPKLELLAILLGISVAETTILKTEVEFEKINLF